MKKTFLLFLTIAVFSAIQVSAQRQMEKLSRGVVAVDRGSDIFLSWRMMGTEAKDIGFNIYRNDSKITPEPITESTNFVDADGTSDDTYYVTPVIDEYDCNGDWKGSAYTDDCGTCVGGNTNQMPCVNFSEGYYRIKPVHSSLCLEPGSAELLQQNCSSDNSQLWSLEKQNDNSYKILNAGNQEYFYAPSVNSGDNLSVSKTSGTSFNISGTTDGNNSYYISPSANTDVNIDVNAASTNPGTHLLFWTFHGDDNQKFIFEKAELYTSNNTLLANENNIKVFPNPVNEHLHLILEEKVSSNAVYELHNASGELLISQKITGKTTTISMNKLAQGLYFLNVHNGDQTYSVKVSKR